MYSIQLILFWRLQAKQVELKTVDFNSHFISRMIPKLDWGVLKSAAETVKFICSVVTSQYYLCSLYM